MTPTAWVTVALCRFSVSGNLEDLTLSAGIYWNCVFGCAGGVLRRLGGRATNALASASGLSSTMAMSISPPSFLMRAGFLACIYSRIAIALFSHRFRSHSSTALRSSDPVCSGTVRTAGVPSAERNALSGNVGAGTAVRA